MNELSRIQSVGFNANVIAKLRHRIERPRSWWRKCQSLKPMKRVIDRVTA